MKFRDNSMLSQNNAADEAYIRSYDFSFLEERFLDSYTCSENEYLEIQDEFKNFLILIGRFDGPLAILGTGIDEFWHTFINFTAKYRSFCDEAFGFFIDHQPNTKLTPVPKQALTNLFSEYKREFGEMSSCWGEGLDAATISKLKSGSVPKNFHHKWSGWTGS